MHVLEEVDSVRAVVQIAVHLGQFSWGDDPHLLILFVLYDDFLWFLPQTCAEHGLDDAVALTVCLVVARTHFLEQHVQASTESMLTAQKVHPVEYYQEKLQKRTKITKTYTITE